jgi:hypothetical protein
MVVLAEQRTRKTGSALSFTVRMDLTIQFSMLLP